MDEFLKLITSQAFPILCVLALVIIGGLLWVLLPLIIHTPTDKGGK